MARKKYRVDLTVGMGTSYTPDPSKEDHYRCFVLDPGLDHDAFVVGFEIRPGEPRIVHHLTLFALDSAEDERAAAALDAADPGPGYECFGDTRVPSRWLVGSGPGGGAIAMPETAASLDSFPMSIPSASCAALAAF